MSHTRVTVIDDDTWLVDQFVRQLTKAGYTVDVAHNSIAAMERIDHARPDVIILDISMPGPNGIVLLHELRSHSDLATIPVIVCTSSAADIPKNSLKPYGVQRVLDKVTMQPGDVVAAVREVV